MALNILGIRPDNAGHASVEKRFTKFLKDRNFDIYEGTYHNSCNNGLAQALRNRFDGTSLSIRGHADHIAVHRTIDNLVFEWEAKSHVNGQYKDLTVEALPLGRHMLEAQCYDKVCLYVLTDADGVDRCFWSANVPPIREIHVPKQRDDAKTAWYEKKLRGMFPRVHIRTNTNSKGSGDPFAIVDQYHVQQLPDWHGVIDQLIRIRSKAADRSRH